jgi:23S rRNA pseudouridine1911/1915/1917 synthase
MSEKIHLIKYIPSEFSGKRLDQALALLFPEHSRARLQSWIKANQVQVNGVFLRGKDKIQGGELIEINAEIAVTETWQAQALPLQVVYEDEYLLVINKPMGLVVHPAIGNPDKTLLNALLHHCPTLATLPRAGIIHRLDKDTSGLLVIAKTLQTHTYLVNELQSRHIHREYETIVNGVMTAGGTVDAPIGRHPTHRTKMAVTNNGKPALTHYRVLKKFRAHTHVHVQLETGRTHQIRVHMAHIHYPIVGDAAYGGRVYLPKQATPQLSEILQHFKRQALHAKQLTLVHPSSQEILKFIAPLPSDMQNLLDELNNDAKTRQLN